MNKKAMISLVIALPCAALLLLRSPDEPREMSVSVLSDKQAFTRKFTARNVTAEVNSAPSPTWSTPAEHDQVLFAQSLSGSSIDGALKADAAGNLILSQDVRDFFDYFLSAADELGPQASIEEIQRYIDTYLPLKAASQAHHVLANYLRYKKYELKLQLQPLASDNVAEQDALIVLRKNFDQLRHKRTELFSDTERKAMFGLESAYQDYTLSSLEIFADDNLSPQQQQSALTDLQSALPDELQASQQKDAQIRRDSQVFSGLTQSELGDTEYHQALVDQGFSQPKADELLSQRQQQRHFESQYLKYRHAVSKLAPADNHQLAIKQLQRAYFTQPEHITRAKLRDLTD